MLTFIQVAIELATMILLLMAVIISSSSTLKNMVRVYILQATTLAAITLLTAVEHGLHQESVFVGALGVLPCLLAYFIPLLLARATVTDALFARGLLSPRNYKKWMARAEPIWLSHGRARVSSVVNILINLGLTVFAFSVAFRLTESGQLQRDSSLISPASTAVSLALLLVGLLVMIIKTDIISQIMGLLIMEHGLFLAAIAVVRAPTLAALFVVSMVGYILVTLLILVRLLPEVNALAHSIEIDEISDLKG